jgi:hypothetical protein
VNVLTAETKLYTLSEAQLEIGKRECGRYGHDYNIMVNSSKNIPVQIACNRCGRGWDVSERQESKSDS